MQGTARKQSFQVKAIFDSLQVLGVTVFVLQMILEQETPPIQEDSTGQCDRMSCDCRTSYRKKTDHSETWAAGESGEPVTSPSWWGVRLDSPVEQDLPRVNRIVSKPPFASFGSGRTGHRKQTENSAG